MKRTKIMATIGPATGTPEKIRALIDAGANAFRINMSHGTHEQWRSFIITIRNVDASIPIVMDTKGPEIRILNVGKPIDLRKGQRFSLSLKPSAEIAYVSHPVTIKAGDPLLFDDGAILAHVESVEGNMLHVLIDTNGTLTERRKVTVPENTIDLPVLMDEDKADLQFCIDMQVDAIALSFTESAADVQACRDIIPSAFVIAKIENHKGVEQSLTIAQAADAVMVARGDLGVEIPSEDVPGVQKRIIHECNQIGRPVIVATQMLETMITEPNPTRAEVSDIANAILDGADCVMLSAETAMGAYSVEAVTVMARVAQKTDPTTQSTVPHRPGERLSVADAISRSVYELAEHLKVNAIICATSSGFSARMVTRFRPSMQIIAVTHDEVTKKRLSFSWGVQSCICPGKELTYKTVYAAVASAKATNFVKDDDQIIVTAGVDTKEVGSTNLIEVHTVRDLLSFHEENT